ncbi:MAG TPA: hydroxymethylbilane synthase [Streptosporangiaceae bacterium]|nr:hydroxymethylbilane synthase [Streptosporangiaceae bacterium]
MSRAPLRLGTRRSPMAVAQSRTIASAIAARTGHEVELVGIESAGDKSRDLLTQIGGTGVFVSALRTSLLAGDVDIAVHSLKDLPVGPADGITLAAVPERDDPRDALVGLNGAKLADLPPGAKIGTGSPRRAAQLLLLRPDVHPVPIRGNAGTRLAKVESGELSAVVLAQAGLARIGRLDAVSQLFEPDEMVPAAGQGALAVECNAGREDLVALLSCIDDAVSRAATTAERSLLAGLEAGCAAPVGAYAAGTEVLRLSGVVVAADGGMALRGSASGALAQAEAIGRQLAADLLSRGAGRYMAVSGGHLSSGDDEK